MHVLNQFKRVQMDIWMSVTDPTKERNIYAHANRLARDIFWMRLERLFRYLCAWSNPMDRVLDFGGGSGAFLPSLAGFYDSVTIVDLDAADAINIAHKMRINNVEILQQNVFAYSPEEKFDVVILADVLEHFKELDAPIAWIKKNLNENGKLFVSLPTENWVYELGRFLVGKQKPADHYHSSSEVLKKLQEHSFVIKEKCYSPNYLVPIPLFEIAVLEHVRL